MKGHGTQFGRKKEAAVAALLTHRNIEEAAKAVGLSANTLLNWLKIPEFDQAYSAKAASREEAEMNLKHRVEKLEEAVVPT
jgi:hypothetical protein